MAASASSTDTMTFDERLKKRLSELPIDEESVRKRALLGNAREVKLAEAVVAQMKANKFAPVDETKMAYAMMMHREGVKFMLMHEDLAQEKAKGKRERERERERK